MNIYGRMKSIKSYKMYESLQNFCIKNLQQWNKIHFLYDYHTKILRSHKRIRNIKMAEFCSNFILRVLYLLYIQIILFKYVKFDGSYCFESKNLYTSLKVTANIDALNYVFFSISDTIYFHKTQIVHLDRWLVTCLFLLFK